MKIIGAALAALALFLGGFVAACSDDERASPTTYRVTTTIPGIGTGGLTGIGVGSSADGQPRLTRSGRALQQFEALLYDTFRQREVSAHYSRARNEWNFACAGSNCAPLAYWSIYFFTFKDARRSTFHLSSKRFSPGYFGNYPAPIRVKGRFVACDRTERRFLITYGSAVGLGLACLKAS